MTTIDIFSGFLGAGKTTLIKKMIQEAYNGEKLVLIENEFGEIGIDGGFMQDAGIEVNEMNSGCICCSLVGDFGKALVQVIEQFHPDRILIEPSGVGKLSDVIGAVRRVESDGVKLGSFITVADATKCKVYLKNFGEFYLNQIETASTIILSRTSNITPEKLAAAASLLREHNSEALIITTPWDELTGKQILDAMQQQNTLNSELAELLAHEQHHHHHDEDCDCPHCHGEHEHHHHHEHHEHHHHDEDCDCPHCHEEHEHHHHHEHHEHHHHDEDCDCPHCHGEHEHHHDHHGHHHADDVFTSWGIETAKKFTADEIESILKELDDEDRFGMVLRAKGIVASTDGTWIHFDHVPHEIDIRSGSAAVTGRICVIGAKLNEEAIASRFGV
ncbi:MAG: GTP-binding protein [Ruminococcaceae bacterium]|nr:GTP-binding protein [Oscillospiraceae bacterium]